SLAKCAKFLAEYARPCNMHQIQFGIVCKSFGIDR
ncbi:MAG: hypothetical protein QOE55_361, partial [Acidobacteriaceae bacterium]|nr:hypothetical protein [Acidobacteriaceae bacterium]